MKPYEQIYIKRITKKEKMREAITIFITLCIILLCIYFFIKYVEVAHAAEGEEMNKFYIMTIANEGKIKLRNSKSPWHIYSNDAAGHYRHKIEHIAENKYIMVYMNKPEPDIFYVQMFRVDGETLTFDIPIKYTACQYLNITKEQAARIVNEIN